ncbi:GAF and ANTAR domain-containing protein [Streptomyces sp. N35]|uniref:GAF and ANTAR domain-containing protein n=1 Tax=Streptomyces sp. N35 TaxID=2795730 RepID=UPI0018F5FA5F|nr:GAF and ANTAR domain-containing protein [Streptomyces sp. N35]
MEPRQRTAQLAALARRRAESARLRGENADKIADRYERLVALTGDQEAAHLAALHHSSAQRHYASAALQETYARRVLNWQRQGGDRPRFMTGVAEACGTPSAALSLHAADHGQLAVAASDEASRTAQDLEFLLGEGPTWEAVATAAPVSACGAELSWRWPGYGPQLALVGLQTVSVIPISAQGGSLGALAVFGTRAEPLDSSALAPVADALTCSLLDAGAGVGDDDLYGGIDHRAVVHQATGIVAVRLGCSVEDALSLIKARAFAEDGPLDTLARRIVQGELSLE